MKLVKALQIAVEAATVGGAFVVMSGSALAADSTSSPTLGQNPAVTQPVVQAPADSSGGIASQPTDQTATQQTTTTAVGGDNNTTGTGTHDNTTTPGGNSVTTGVPSGGNNAQPSSTQTATKTPDASVGPVAFDDKTGPTQPKDATTVPIVQVVTQPATPAAKVPGESEALVPVKIRTTIMPIQPTITNRVEIPGDLAAAIPSAPATKKSPQPAKSNGALGRITAVLAGTVMPQPLAPHIGAPDRLAPVLSLLTLLVLLGDVFVFTYGLWLRRGGFATAARSDEPARILSSLFATPLFLGYVWAQRRQHSPNLVVAETNMRIVMFPALSERRKSI